MRIIFFTQEDPFYVKIFFDEFMSKYECPDEIKAIVISKPMGKKSILKLAKQMFNFYGINNFIRMGFKYIYIKAISKMRIQSIVYTIKQLMEKHTIQIIERSDLNSTEFIKQISKYDADLFISVASPIIFGDDLIKIPKMDCINIHNAILPKYRGMMPNFWQLYNKENEFGITVHRIAKGIDTGDIILQIKILAEDNESLDHLIRRTKKIGAGLMIKIIEDYRHKRIRSRKMEGKGSYYSFPTKEDVNEFKRRGCRIF